MPNTPRRWALRDRTTTLHQAVDDAVGAFSTLPDYQRYLQQMAAFRLPVERSLRDVVWPVQFGSWRPTTISDAIGTDLADCGVCLTDEESVVTPAGLNDLLGVVYVLQGSSLGSQILLKRAEALGLSDQFGARHLAAQADGTQQWRCFLDLLEAADDIDMDRVVAASSATFHQAKSAFSGELISA